MGEIEGKVQGQKPKISKLAIASVSLGVLGFLILPLASVQHYPAGINVLFLNVVGLLGIIGLIVGVVAVVRIKRTKGMLKGRVLAILGITLTTLTFGICLERIHRPRSHAYFMPCGFNLSRLGRAMLIYASDNGQYPEPNQWCDLLIEHGEVRVENFVCSSIVVHWPLKGGRMFSWPFPKMGRCHYAINPNCKPDSPPDTVLLFETKEGWNQFGGPELLTTERHKGDGCNILSNDTHVAFERWTAESNWGEAVINERRKQK